MKNLFITVCILSSGLTYAQELTLPEYNWKVTDISTKNMSKESIFNRMDTKLVKVSKSICSNRALMWVYDMKRNLNIDAAKIFLFYTKKTGEVGRKTWWYHVAPMVNDHGKLWVVDPGFPGFIEGPLAKEEWLHKFVGSDRCKEIKSGENELIERMFQGQVYPSHTSYGSYDCYYRVTPAGY